MVYRRIVLILLVWQYISVALAQTVSPQAISSGQLSGQIGAYKVSSTIGQLMTLTVTNGNYTVTLGFQQPTYEVYTFVNNLWHQNFAVNVYPNPFKDHLAIGVAETPILSYKIYDLSGKTIVEQFVSEAQSTYEINTSNLAIGTYILEIQGVQVLQKTYVKIIKS